MIVTNLFLTDTEIDSHSLNVFYSHAESFTAVSWQSIGLEMAKAALANEGGKIFDGLFIPEIGTVVKIDYASVLVELLKVMVLTLKENISEDQIRTIGSEVTAIQEKMILYNQSQNTTVHLDHATITVVALYAKLQNMNKLGFQSYSLVTNMYISILQERIKKYGVGEKIKLRELIDISSDHIKNTQSLFFSWYHARYTNPRRVGAPINGTYYYEFDGRAQSINVPQLKNWFINAGMPLRSDLTSYDDAFSLYYSTIKGQGWGAFKTAALDVIYDSIRNIWKQIRKKT
jgi:hypothetical protein